MSNLFSLTSVIYSLDFVIGPHKKSHVKKSIFFPKHCNDIQKSNGKPFVSGFSKGVALKATFSGIWRHVELSQLGEALLLSGR